MADLSLTNIEYEALRMLSVSPISNVYLNLLFDFLPDLKKSELEKIISSDLIYKVDSKNYPFYVSHEFKPRVRQDLIKTSNILDLAHYYQIVEEITANILNLNLENYDLLIMSTTQDNEIKYMRDLKLLIHNSWRELHSEIIDEINMSSAVTKSVEI